MELIFEMYSMYSILDCVPKDRLSCIQTRENYIWSGIMISWLIYLLLLFYCDYYALYCVLLCGPKNGNWRVVYTYGQKSVIRHIESYFLTLNCVCLLFYIVWLAKVADQKMVCLCIYGGKCNKKFGQKVLHFVRFDRDKNLHMLLRTELDNRQRAEPISLH